VLAHLEDEISFRGQQGPNQGAKGLPRATSSTFDLAHVIGGQETNGLQCPYSSTALAISGEELVAHISKAVGLLESRYHLGPFACVLGLEYFNAVQTPNGSLVLPQDRILPLLGGGPLMRSSALADASGVVIALGGAPIDLVIATDISVDFLQVTAEAWFVFRVYEKFVLRINQPDAIECIPARP
jgi:uncharacterized linocin/CFP29 family protein